MGLLEVFVGIDEGLGVVSGLSRCSPNTMYCPKLILLISLGPERMRRSCSKSAVSFFQSYKQYSLGSNAQRSAFKFLNPKP